MPETTIVVLEALVVATAGTVVATVLLVVDVRMMVDSTVLGAVIEE